MKKLFLILALVGCIEVPTGLVDQLEELAIEAEAGFVNCTPLTLELAIQQEGFCDVLNADSTRIDPNVVVWTSSVPSAVTVTTAGAIRAETVVSTNVVITAAGPNGSSAFIVLQTF